MPQQGRQGAYFLYRGLGGGWQDNYGQPKAPVTVQRNYAAADVYVFPSTMETWGLAAVEAMLSGVPVVGTFECMTEVVPEFAGIYVPSQDPSDLAEAITRARELALDLVEVAPTERPPVCRIVNSGSGRSVFCPSGRGSVARMSGRCTGPSSGAAG